MKRGAEDRDNPNFNVGQNSTPEEIAARPRVRAARNAFIAGGLTTAGWTGTALALSNAPITAPIVFGTAGIAGLQVATVFGLGYVGYKAVTSATSAVGNFFSRNNTNAQNLPEQQENEVLVDNGMEVQQPVEEKAEEIIIDEKMEAQEEKKDEQKIENPTKRRKLESDEDTYELNKQNLEAQVAALKQDLAKSNCKTLFSKLDKIYANAPDAQFENGTLADAQPARNKVQFLRWEVKSLTNLSESNKSAQAKVKSTISRKADAKLEKASNKSKI